jgi:hypothetical protein
MRKDAEEIFTRAGISIEGNEDVFQQVTDILGETMAQGSVLMGLSLKRVEHYSQQMDTLVDDLKKLKASGEIA